MASGTPSRQVRISLGDLNFHPPPPSPPLMLTLNYLGKNYKTASAEGRRRRTGGTLRRKNIGERQRTAGGVKIMRRNIYPGRARVGQKLEEKKIHSAENCRALPKLPYSIS